MKSIDIKLKGKDGYVDGELVGRVSISDSLSNYLERLNYESMTYSNLVPSIIEGCNDLDALDTNERFEKFMDRVIKADLEKNIAMGEAAELFIEEHSELKEIREKIEVSVDFRGNEIFGVYRAKGGGH